MFARRIRFIPIGLVVAAFAVSVAAPPALSDAKPAAGLHIAGNRILNKAGQVLHLHGVNRSGTEYACIQGWGIFDGPSDAASVAAMAAWHINIVRIPLNEDCWLDVNTGGISPAYTGQSYVNAIVDYVRLLHEYGIYAELSLMWGAPGDAQATYQANAPDEDHSPAMWMSMAKTFRNDPNVILAPWGETTVSWSCFLHGCDDGATYGSPHDGGAGCGSDCWYYNSAGMQQAVTDMRSSGYNGPIAIPCIDYANDCLDANGSWLQDMPSDPDHQLIAEAHVYGDNTCDSTTCFDTTFAPVARRVPLIFGEVGESSDTSDCGTSQISTIVTWADAHHVGYAAWTWDTWGTCLALISSYNGTPANAYGAWIRAHYRNAK
jgi:endoglucanase